jgi:protein involved in polysaccharide export with SLBB domain
MRARLESQRSLRRAWLALGAAAGLCAAAPQIVRADEAGPLHYEIQRGDSLDIKVFNATELSEQVVVRPDGKISVQVLDDVEAAGKTPTELATTLQEAWSQSFSDPRVTVLVREFAMRNVFVGGEVGADGIVPLRNRMTAVSAVFAAGGFQSTAQLSNVIVLRDAGGTPEAHKIDVRKVLDGSTPDFALAAYDVVWVPKSKIARVNLWVEQYVKHVLPVNLTGAVQYNYLAGGM